MLLLVLGGAIAGFFFDPWPWGFILVTVFTALAFLNRLPIYRRSSEGLTSGQAALTMASAFFLGIAGNLVLAMIPMAMVWHLLAN